MTTPGKAGFNCVLTCGDQEIGYAKNVDGPNATAGKIDATTRNSAGWKRYLQGLKEWTLKIEQLFVADNAGLQALRTAYLTGSEIAVKAVDDEGNGWSGDAIVTELGFGQPLDDAVSMPVTLDGTGPLAVEGAGS